MRRIGVLVAATADDPEYQPRMKAFGQGLALLGWTDGRNVQVDTRWAATNADDIRKHAVELAALAPDAILAGSGTTTVAPLLQATRTVPIVFVVVIDPVGAGFVSSLARPGINTAGGSVSGSAINMASPLRRWASLFVRRYVPQADSPSGV
jgi:putative ABC transport system substrate-binding protein